MSRETKTPGDIAPGDETNSPPNANTNVKAGWFRAMRTEDSRELLKANNHAFCLLWTIADRGRFSDNFNRHNLALGEAFLGDYENCGMSHRQYRTAMEQLSKWGFATFKKTNKGTIAKLANTKVFSIFKLEADNQNGSRATSQRQTADKQPTTNEDRKNEKSSRAISDAFRNLKIDLEKNGREDWHSLTLTQKACRILGPDELQLRDQRWQRRIASNPARLTDVLDKMHADIKEGAIIKNRGGYAEKLWQEAA